ncbi:4a-hydroxytetrahydrobiopterin dehydratase [Streptomyces sp. NBC_01498]|uniref:4a-hydroxytetrahydrobiopterin dehydratase n=1 Tax=Streptomyces sp. NBC_01498 TaxID=2975870 RepID=UPI002E7BB898|nr:4a-hydroxytetrahydrobiopterin dehydratase [Streptomyces sp. NBC_01498]WTL23758.1 4a-hydroxytetrahydrobiopterin dehydratase [Streptomyces sp. NBC_01498]
MTKESLTAREVEDRLPALPEWTVEYGKLTRTYRLADHFAAAAMVLHVARIQEELNHHSDLTLGYNTVDVAVNSHDVGGITDRDFDLAARVEEIAPAHGAE